MRLLFFSVLLCGGCCTTGLKAKCCPPPSTQIVEVAKPCPLPPVPVLPEVLATDKDCPAPYVCFDLPNTKLLAERQHLMRLWIKEAQALCGVPASRPVR